MIGGGFILDVFQNQCLTTDHSAVCHRNCEWLLETEAGRGSGRSCPVLLGWGRRVWRAGGQAGRRRGLPVGKPGTAHNCEALLFAFTPAVDLPLHLDAILYVCFPTPWTLFQENLNVGSLIAQTPGTFSMGCELPWLPGIFRPFTYLCGVSGLPKTHEPTLDPPLC